MYASKNQTWLEFVLPLFLFCLLVLVGCTSGRYQEVADGERATGGGSAVPNRTSGAEAQPVSDIAAKREEPTTAETPPADAEEPAPAEELSETGEEDEAAGEESTEQTAVLEKTHQTLYLSNDESMSTATAQRIEKMLADGRLPNPWEMKPHEMLNYYQFPFRQSEQVGPFDVSFLVAPADPEWAEIAYGEAPEGKRLVHVAYQVKNRMISHARRQNWNLTFVVDVSGSMKSEDKMGYTRRALEVAYRNFKSGDVINIVTFDNEAAPLTEGLTIGSPGAKSRYMAAVNELEPDGGTNLKAGLDLGYEVAWRQYAEGRENRVIMLTDANANRGDVSLDSISRATRNQDLEGIRFSGVGVGINFNGRLLDEMAERGKGAYVFLGSEKYVDTLFGELFTSLCEPVAFDMRIAMDYPATWQMARFYGEESSAVKEEVQTFHFFSGSHQLYLSDFWVPEKDLQATTDETFAFRLNFDPVDGGDRKSLERVYPVHKSLAERSPILRKALLAHFLATFLGQRPADFHQAQQALAYFEGAGLATLDEESKQLLKHLTQVTRFER